MLKSLNTLPMGACIRGRYLIKSFIGQGSSGAVYLVQDLKSRSASGDIFALKEVNSLSSQEIYQFAFSGVALLKLHHPALAHIIDIPKDEKQERVYLLMEYIEGPDLDTLWQQRPGQKYSWLEVKALLSPIAEAVEYLHSQQPSVVHRDIKPVNIIVPESGEGAILVDFGIVRTEKNNIEVDDLLASYKAPELYRGDGDGRADIYGLAGTCYSLLTGILPAPSLIRQAQVDGGNIDPLVLASRLVPTIPQATAEALQKAMALEPSDRFSSTKQFWEAMQGITKKNSGLVSTKKPAVDPIPPIASNTSNATSTPKATSAAQLATSNAVEVKHEQVTRDIARVERHFPREKLRKLTTRKMLLPVIVAALLISLLSLAMTMNFWSLIGHHAASPVVTSHSAPVQSSGTAQVQTTPTTGNSPYATITGMYAGTIYNIVPNVSTSIAVDLQQTEGHLHGTVVLGPKIQGGGQFNGTIDTSKHFQLLIVNTAGQITMLLQGSLQSTTSLSGEYYSCTPSHDGTCHHSRSNYGLWNAVLMTH